MEIHYIRKPLQPLFGTEISEIRMPVEILGREFACACELSIFRIDHPADSRSFCNASISSESFFRGG